MTLLRTEYYQVSLQIFHLISGRNDTTRLDHQHHRLLWRAGPMHHAFCDCRALSRAEIERPAFQINEQSSGYDKEEFVVVVVLMPVKLALHNAEPNDAVVNLRESLIPPRIVSRRDYAWHIYYFQMFMQNVEVDVVSVIVRHGSIVAVFARRWS